MRAMIAIVNLHPNSHDLTLRVTADGRETHIGWFDNYDDAAYGSSLIRQTFKLLNIEVASTTDERELKNAQGN